MLLERIMEDKQNMSAKSVVRRNLDEQSDTINRGLAVKNAISVNKTTVDFDKTDIGDECFRLVKISQSGAGTPVTLSSDSPDLFRIAIGVKKLVFEDELTFTPTEAGTFVHVRFTPARAGQHAGSLILKTADSQQTITLNGKGGNYVATPASEQIRGETSHWKWAAMLIVLGGVGYAAYTYRCELVPGLCNQTDEIPQTRIQPSLSSPVQTIESEGLETETTEPTRQVQEKKVTEPTTRLVRPEKQTPESQPLPQRERKPAQKVVPTSTPTQENKPTPKNSSSDESELERELNKKPGT